MKKILGIDYGNKYIGLALSDENQKIALPYKVIENKGKKFLKEELENLCFEKEVGKVVIGLPLGLSGLETKQTLKVKEIVDFFKKEFFIPIEIEDERLTSKMADGLLGKVKTKRSDAVAAMIILQSYLDRRKKGSD